MFGEIPIDMQSSLCQRVLDCEGKAEKTDDAYLLGALRSATRFSNACCGGVAVEGEEFCTHEFDIKICDRQYQSQSWREVAYHPVKALSLVERGGRPGKPSQSRTRQILALRSGLTCAYLLVRCASHLSWM